VALAATRTKRRRPVTGKTVAAVVAVVVARVKRYGVAG
jgi:hypothetical protein